MAFSSALQRRMCEKSVSDSPPDTPGGFSTLGPRLSKAIAASAKGVTPEDDVVSLTSGVLALLQALHVAYSERSFQQQLKQLRSEAGGNSHMFLSLLGPLAAQVQSPVFNRFGMPSGQRGVMVMKLGVRLVSHDNLEVQRMAGDLRELLGLEREEVVDTTFLSRTAESEMSKLVAALQRSSPAVLGALAAALGLLRDASVQQIATEVPNLKRRAKELARAQMSRPSQDVVGPGRILAADMQGASPQELQEKLTEMFERYLQKMLARAATDLESFTRPPLDFRCSWADQIIEPRHAEELWQASMSASIARTADADWLSLNVGVSVIDDVVEREIVARARIELDELEMAGDVKPSKDPCNVGARSVWLHFESEEEARRLPPALRELCKCLAGLPVALENVQRLEPGIAALSLRVHPHIMAATYRKGTEYHCHKDSYDGEDNQRVLTVLLYLNPNWQPGDGGELRIFGTLQEAGRRTLDKGSYVDIAPLCGRLVMFRSRDVWHAVREPREKRWALTLWVMGE